MGHVVCGIPEPQKAITGRDLGTSHKPTAGGNIVAEVHST
jgi:hypothetical protein